MPMSSGGHVESSSDCATRPRAREIGLTGYAVPIQPSLHIGRYVMATAEHREPCDSRGSRTVLGAPGGEIPPGDSPKTVFGSAPASSWSRAASGMRGSLRRGIVRLLCSDHAQPPHEIPDSPVRP